MSDGVKIIPKRPTEKAEAGFTLLEAVVAAIVLATVVAICMPSFISYVQRVKFEGAARSIASDLRLVQSLAVSRGHRYRLLFSGNALSASPPITYRVEVDQGTTGAPNWQLARGIFPNDQRSISVEYPGVRIDGRAGAPSAQVTGATINQAQTFAGNEATINIRGLAEGLGTVYLMNDAGDMLAVTLSPTGSASILRYSSHDTAGNWSSL